MTDRHKHMVVNRSVFGQAPFSISLSVVGMTLIMLFTAIEPASSAGLGFWQRLLFWTAQISVALAGILLASYMIRLLASTRLSDIWLILFTGIIASIVVSPAFAFIENIFPDLDRAPDSALDEFEQLGLVPELIAQSLETMPSLTIVWLLVNLPILLSSTFINDSDTRYKSNDELPPAREKARDQHRKDDNSKQLDARKQFLLKLPENIGVEIMYVSSDLHYLNITTEKGTTLILGSIAKFAEIFDDDGFLVHRSHWVNKAYVERILISGKNALCVMNNGKTVPISRSKRKLLKAYFGNNHSTNTHNVVSLKSNID